MLPTSTNHLIPALGQMPVPSSDDCGQGQRCLWVASSALGGPQSHWTEILRRLVISHFFLSFFPSLQVICSLWASQWLSGKEPTCSAGDVGSILGSGPSPRGGHASPLQDSCLENPMDRRAWGAMVHGVPRSRTRLKWLSTQTCKHAHSDTWNKTAWEVTHLCIPLLLNANIQQSPLWGIQSPEAGVYSSRPFWRGILYIYIYNFLGFLWSFFFAQRGSYSIHYSVIWLFHLTVVWTSLWVS